MRYREFLDKVGRRFKNCYFEGKSKAIVFHERENHLFYGTPKIVVREGKSDYGEELIFQFLITDRCLSYKANSKHNVIEIYLPKLEGIQFLEAAVKRLKNGED